jgi:uncharacterized membrane protein YccC
VSGPRPLSRKAEALLERFGLSREHLLGVRFAVNVFIATAIVWFTLKRLGVANPIWAIASMVAAADPQPEEARRMMRCRLINVLVGCAVGFTMLLLGDHSDWLLPFALAVAVLISSYVVRIKTMWRQAPITAAIVLAAGISQGAKVAGIATGLHKVAEVLFGCIVGLLVSWLMSKVWLIQTPPTQSQLAGAQDAVGKGAGDKTGS